MSHQWILRSLSVTVACCAAVFGLTSANSQEPKEDPALDDKKEKHSDKVDTKTLGGDKRYLTFISTDKPIYKEKEKVYVRGVVLNAADHKPLPDSDQLYVSIEIKGPKGDVVSAGQTNTQDSVWGFAWDVPEGQAGGEYKVRVNYPWTGDAPAERKFDIRAYRAPRLKSQIVFMRDGYGPGDTVTATLDVKRAEGGVPVGAKVTVNARVDGAELKGSASTVDEQGLCSVKFDLPKNIARGDGTLSLVIEDGGVVETASKTIPILLQTVDLKMYPEGGDLVAGYNNRVYIQAKQTNGKPADLAGKIYSENNKEVGEFRTTHEGRGRFAFTPESGKDYYLSISQPLGITKRFKLPEVKRNGAVVQAESNVFEKNQPIKLLVGCTEPSYRVTLAKREVEISSYKVDRGVRPGTLSPVAFNLPQGVDGVLTVTVWDGKNTPLAERLIFRQPANPLKVTITPNQKTYVPGDKTSLTIKTTDAAGKPVSAVVGLTVTDDSVLEMIEKREQAPRLPVMFFLEPEVEDLADAHVYLDANNPKASLATDLLLGTQGWRRFALMDLPTFIEAHGDSARRVVALKLRTNVDGFGKMAAFKEGGFDLARAKADMPMPPVRMAAFARDNLKKNMEGDKNIVVNPRPILKDFRQQAAQPLQEQAKPVSKVEGKMQRALANNRAAGLAMRMAADEDDGMFAQVVYVREYAHQARPNRKPTDRVDFTETLYWNSGVKTDATTGEAKVSFSLNDSVSTFRVLADAFAGGGGLGSTSIGVESVQPFYTEAKLPLEVTSGDQILLPISLVNASGNSLTAPDFDINLKGDCKLLDKPKQNTQLGVGERLRYIQPIAVGLGVGVQDLVLNSQAGVFQDKVSRTLNVKAKGFPIELPFGGLIEAGQTIEHKITIPDTVVPFSIACNTAVYPTPLANMTEALQRMIQDPNGCFEQTSSTSYPLTMAQQYFVSHSGVDPKLIETSRQKLDAGYKRLVGFWCPDRGYEWFGENPGHEALTAFGLLHFDDMAEVRDVDKNMMNSTREWLLKQKDGKGGFSRKRRSLHTWIEDKDCSNAYVIWALLESGQPAADLKEEIAALETAAQVSKNSYVMALAANALYLAGQKDSAKKLMDKLAAKQKTDGHVDGITSSIVGSGGESLLVEGSSLATLAWMREPAYSGNVERSIKFLADSCKAGRYGSTQATVLALRAIVQYDKNRAHPKAPGKVRVFVDGQAVGDWQAFTASTSGAIKLPDISELLTPGEHTLKLQMEGGGQMPYSMAVKYNALTPASSKECKLDISVNLAQNKVTEGNSTEANVTVKNTSAEVIPSPVAIVGLPGGLEARHDQLKELVKKGKIDAYEVLGREVVLYWRTLPADARVELPLSLIAAVPGSYTGPASRTYLYYTDEHKHWVPGVKVEIAAK